MKILLLCLSCGAAGWFARDLVRLGWNPENKTVTVQLPRVHVEPARGISKPSQVQKATQVAQTPSKTQENTFQEPEGQSIGRQIQNNGLFNLHPTEPRAL